MTINRNLPTDTNFADILSNVLPSTGAPGQTGVIGSKPGGEHNNNSNGNGASNNNANGMDAYYQNAGSGKGVLTVGHSCQVWNLVIITYLFPLLR